MNNSDLVLLTGGTGFVGRAVHGVIKRAGRPIRLAVRSMPPGPSAGVVAVGDLADRPDWDTALDGVQVVIHCAARAHVLRERTADPLEAFRRVNRDATLDLARAAAGAGVRRFIFVSSIGVLGERTTAGHPFTAASLPGPVVPYAVSKREAEDGLVELAARSGMEVVIVRPPLVHGPGAPGNFGRLVRLVQSGWPLPLGGLRNRRTFVARENLVDLIIRAIDHPGAPGAPLLAGDARAISTPQLLDLIAQGLGRPLRLVRIPGLPALAGLPMVGGPIAKLVDSLEVDISATQRRLDWTPPISVEEGIRSMARGGEGAR